MLNEIKTLLSQCNLERAVITVDFQSNDAITLMISADQKAVSKPPTANHALLAALATPLVITGTLETIEHELAGYLERYAAQYTALTNVTSVSSNVGAMQDKLANIKTATPKKAAKKATKKPKEQPSTATATADKSTESTASNVVEPDNFDLFSSTL